MWKVAFKTLAADRGKLLTALVGVVFSVVLVNVQGGLFLGLIAKASLLIDQGHADVWVGHKKMTNVDFPTEIPRRWIHRVQSVPGVKRAEAYLLGHSTMTLPDGGFEPVLVVGCDPASLMGGTNESFGCDPSVIRQADGVIVDTFDAPKIRNPRLGDLREIGRRRARVVGMTSGMVGFLVTPYVFTTLDRAASYLGRSSSDASYFLVELEEGADAEAVCQQIQQRAPELEVYTRRQYAWLSISYWLKRTGLGISFGAATVLGLLVGLLIVGQTLYASVLDRLAEFATLKAIGAAERQIHGVVVTQALLLALVGSALGLVAVAFIQAGFSSPRAPIVLPWFVTGGSCLLVIGICLASSLLPYLRIRTIDPAMVMQGA
jgi:putative ABC transport system permease protein